MQSETKSRNVERVGSSEGERGVEAIPVQSPNKSTPTGFQIMHKLG